ncbi:MAP7 domain-containing protein 1-like [Aedes aegypti]|uniref:Uncharacterized protein n=1 Tax=Aedes aegypti TaxID=7159 RepID=A0A6I8TLT2_AEDAE|nr:MAP7 domain-containing protein 1-like [Aedes aegypti]
MLQTSIKLLSSHNRWLKNKVVEEVHVEELKIEQPPQAMEPEKRQNVKLSSNGNKSLPRRKPASAREGRVPSQAGRGNHPLGQGLDEERMQQAIQEAPKREEAEKKAHEKAERQRVEMAERLRKEEKEHGEQCRPSCPERWPREAPTTQSEENKDSAMS